MTHVMHVMARRANKGRRVRMVASALTFGETRSTHSVVFRRNGDTEGFWKISEKGASAPLRALARFKSANKGRCDAEDAADEIRRDSKKQWSSI